MGGGYGFMTIYIDVLFLSNLIINLILLYATGFCVNRKNSFFRSLISAAVGAIYLCMMFFSANYTIIESLGFKLIISVAMMFLSFNFKKTPDFLKTLAVYYILNFVLAGGVIFANSILNICVLTNGVVYFKTTALSLAAGILIVGLSGGGFFYIIKKSILSREAENEIIIYYCGNEIKLKAFSDTGNALVDPLSKASVIVVPKSRIAHIINNQNSEEIKNLRIIPCNTVMNKGGMLYGFKPDKLIYNEKELNAIVAISETESEHDAIINPLTLI